MLSCWKLSATNSAIHDATHDFLCKVCFSDEATVRVSGVCRTGGNKSPHTTCGIVRDSAKRTCAVASCSTE